MGMAVGMAAWQKHIWQRIFNKENYPVVDHYTYVLGGDGCMMEGISSEAFSLAGTLGLSKLIVLYDSNRISIEGSTDIAFTENVQERMEAFGFQTLDVAGRQQPGGDRQSHRSGKGGYAPARPSSPFIPRSVMAARQNRARQVRMASLWAKRISRL